MALARIPKSVGTTDSERELAALAETTFLNLWSYPNVYRDQTAGPGSSIGKEVCDLLVVCGDDVIVFSDKTVAYSENGTEELKWSRWFRGAVLKSRKQVLGAQRWIQQHPDRIFLDESCRVPFPLGIPSREIARFHLIIVARGSALASIRYWNGGSGSLMISSDLCGAGPQIDSNGQSSPPFVIGDINPGGSFVHVLDDVTLHALLQELDSISDFLTYCREKEDFLRSSKAINAPGEEDLLAFYILNKSHGSRGFPELADSNSIQDRKSGVVIQEGLWDEIQSKTGYQNRARANAVSYIWDNLILTYTKHIMSGTMLRHGQQNSLVDVESGVRAMALENRLERRLLGGILKDAFETASPTALYVRFISVSESLETSSKIYVLLQVPHDKATGPSDYESYLEFRQKVLLAYCARCLERYPICERVIGFAMEPPMFSQHLSEDLVQLSPSDVTEDMLDAANRIADLVGIMREDTLKFHRTTIDEFPGES